MQSTDMREFPATPSVLLPGVGLVEIQECAAARDAALPHYRDGARTEAAAHAAARVLYAGYDQMRETTRAMLLAEAHTVLAYVEQLREKAAAEDAETEQDRAAEQAAERYFEDRGFDDARAQEQYEHGHGLNVAAW